MGLTRTQRHAACTLAFMLAAVPATLRAQSFDDLLRTGRAQTDSGKADAAVKTLEKAVKANAQNPEGHFQLGRALGSVAQRASVLRQPFLAKRLKAEFEKTVELDAKHVAGREGLMQFYLQAPGVMGGSVGKAREQAAVIAKLSPLRGHLADATIANHEKDPGGAERAYRVAATEFPDSLNAATSFANFLANNNRADEAFSELDRYLAKHATNRVALFWVGRTAAITGKRLDRGEQALKHVLAAPPDADAPRVAPEAVHLRLGEIAARRGDKPKARASYEEALRINPRFEQAKRALAAL